MSGHTRRKLSPPQVAGEWGVSETKIIGFIKSGELRAIDASSRRGTRPRYLIDRHDLEAFEQARAVTPRHAHATRTRKRRDSDVVEFF